jgi:membrane protein DedA with SNARE-associated domain
VPAASVLTEITHAVTAVIGDYGLYAVFLLMLVDAVFPAASEPVMVYAGAVASGAFAGQAVTLGGYDFEPGFPAYAAMASAGTVGYLIGSIGGWALGDYGGRPWLERHGRWLHLDAAKLDRAEAWFGRHGEWAVLLGRITPVVRSFISIPAGVFRAPLPAYVALTALGSAAWCFGLAGAGWAAGSSWESFHDSFRFVDYVVAALVVGGIGLVAWKLRRSRRAGRDATRGYTGPE